MCVRCAYYDGCASVYAPGDLGEKKDHPVIFYIHRYLLTPLSTNFSLIIFYFFARSGYVQGIESQANGNDFVRKAGGGVVAVFIQYRLGVTLGAEICKSSCVTNGWNS